ncbi:Prefoldin subunit-domain-containing protein [Parachaetomium inaequale]|uniref:Prefoldin subunit-domain-containing protein n=1 Tax=Parachaetomium inaequale TaxID=2588326 RepID=A0AAN6PPP0_9PEZI|nr:Prefoldin subunit-domain-containing protein [Parachaetomium inaequale]
MAQPTKDHLSDLDRHVEQLESKVTQLRASLTHWQQWYLDYSALKEEVEQLVIAPTGAGGDDPPPPPPPHEQLRRIRRDFDSQLLTKKEINEIMGKNDLREPAQIVGVLARRIDYVEQNIETLAKLLEKEENRLAAASVVALPDAGTDEESGLPFTDIIEELDEEGNVVSFRLQGGAEAEPKIVEALKKAGIREGDLPETEAELEKALGALGLGAKEEEEEVKKAAAAVGAAATASGGGGGEQNAARDEPVVGRKKSVSFAEDTKDGHDAVELAQSRAAQDLARLMQKAKEQEAIDLSSAVIPDNESAEASQLRRDMLEYGMSEIGPVVAELQLEEDYSGDEDDMDWVGTDDESEDETTDDDAEDELGRSKRRTVTSDYISRMQELEKRLNLGTAFTVGASETKPKKLDEGIGRIAVVAESGSSAAPAAAAPKAKKSVSFATKLDIAPDTASPLTSDIKSRERKIADVGDVVEKVAEEEMLKDPEEPPKRVSRFKKQRATVASPSPSPAAALPPGPHQLPTNFGGAVSTSSPAQPTPPEHQTLANTVVERSAAADPTGPDDMDDAVLYQAAAVEYNRLRSQLIRKQGGFAQQDGAIDSESGLVPLDEELGGPKRMSKFKAARLTKLQ